MHLTQTTLSPEHEESLVEMLVEVFGHDATKEQVGDLLLWMLESVSGFEHMPESRARFLVNYFWSKYCGKKPH